MKKAFLPIILGSDENAYGNARLFNEAYGVKPLLLCTRTLLPTYASRLFDLKCIDNFDSDEVFQPALLAVLKEKSAEYEKLVVVACSDYYSVLMSKHYDSFEGLVANGFSDFSLLEQLDTKDRFYSLCEKYGLDYPKTYIAEPEDRIGAVEKMGFDFPVVVKPENSNATEYLHCSFEGKKKVYFFDTKEEYLDIVGKMNRCDYRGKLIIQEFIPGGDDSMRVMNCYSDNNGKVRFMCLGQPVLEEYSPHTLGNYAAIISRGDEEIYTRIKNFLEEIGYVGFANFDMKYDARSGKYMLFEINPRPGRSSFFVRAAGHNMMKIMTDCTVFGKVGPTVTSFSSALWSAVPKGVLKKYVKNPALKKEICSLWGKKSFRRTLFCREDFSFRRYLKIYRYYLAYYKAFRLYWFDKEKKQ